MTKKYDVLEIAGIEKLVRKGTDVIYYCTTETETNPEPETETNTEPDTETNLEPETETNTEPETETNPEHRNR